MIIHPIPPLYDKNSRVLILGSFPSVKSREELFFYGHPQNRFWKVISLLFGVDEPNGIESKKQLLLSHGIALWDVIGSCEIIGSMDSSIKNAVPNDISKIIESSKINKIFLNGKTAEKYYNKFLKKSLNIESVGLPSTSPANAAFTLPRLVDEWSVIQNEPDALR